MHFLSLHLSTWPALSLVPWQLSPVCFILGWAVCYTSEMRKRALGGCMATSHQTAKAGLPLLETRYGKPSPTGEWTLQRSFLTYTVLIDCISQAMGKLGTSLSSGHVLMNGTLTQVLLVGAPTRGRSHTTTLCFLSVMWLLVRIVLEESYEIWS